jgi:hypothetical protein
VTHLGFGTPDFMANKTAMRAELDRRHAANIRADGERGLSADDPAGFSLHPWLPIEDAGLFPGAASPCASAEASICKEAYDTGRRHLTAIAPPSGKGFTAIAFGAISLRVPESARAMEKEFYTKALGMRVVAERRDELVLRFGKNTLNICSGVDPGGKPICDRFGLLIQNYNHASVGNELKRRGLNPRELSKQRWSIADPGGFPVDVWGSADV